MHLELVELLRCPNPHAPSVLVVSSDKTSARYVMQGVLGCPECGAEYPIRDGISLFGADSPEAARGSTVDPANADSELALRVAAQLAMTEGRSVYTLVGYSSRVVLAIRAVVPARLIVINPVGVDAIGDASITLATAPAGVVRTQGRLPLTRSRMDGLAFASQPDAGWLAQAVELLKPGGRVVAPATGAVPVGVVELVRDAHQWVATRERVASAPIGMTRR